MSIRTQIFLTALRGLAQIAEETATMIEKEDYQLTDLDSALEATMEARNAFCSDQLMIIQDGYVEWQKSDAQKEEEEVRKAS